MNPLDSLTVCVTTFGAQPRLERALESLRAAGIRRVTVAAASPAEGTLALLRAYSFASEFISFDYVVIEQDPGCNSTWLAALYLARTERVIVLHDDDTLCEYFGEVYAGTIAPLLDCKKARWATWQADHLHDDGTRTPCPFWQRPGGVYPAGDLLAIVGRFGRLSLSPIVSVLDRGTCIDACKEAEQTLTANASYLRPGMLLGTEILVYLRHIAAFKDWLYLDLVLSCYGVHQGSGTIKAETDKTTKPLCDGYDLARTQGANRPPALRPKLILAYSFYPNCSEEERARNARAYETWQWHFGTGDVVELPVPDSDVRTSDRELGDFRPAAFIKDVLDRACAHARPEDIVVYANRDVGLTTDAGTKLFVGLVCGHGATACFRRILTPEPGRVYKNLWAYPWDGGFDVFAFYPSWWQANRHKMPDMVMGREVWDTVFRTLVDEHRRGEPVTDVVTDIDENPAYADGVCWHKEHLSDWQINRKTSPGNLHNLKLATEFFAARGINLVSHSLVSPALPPPE